MHFNRLQGAPAGYDPVSVECLDDNAASEFVAGSLARNALTEVEAHLASCRDCRDLVAALAGSGDTDSQARTRQRAGESYAGKLPRALNIGDRVGRYLVLSTLGTGGMGIVFAAYDPQLDRKVALKLLRANLGAGIHAREARARLKREAQAIAQLSHPNVVHVYDVGATDDGDVYIAMEFVEGDTVTAWLKRYPRMWREVLDVFLQAGRGLSAAHGVGLLHRDFKPDNVLVGGDGRVRVTDFGLARSLLVPDGDAAEPRPVAAGSALRAELTSTGAVLGTPRYMAPEQMTGPAIDARADQFSFCVALYEALYSMHPLPGATSVAMLETGEPAMAPPEGTRVPPAIARAVQRGLDRDRGKRFGTMASLLAELEPKPLRSPMRWFALAGLAVVLIGGVTAAMAIRPPTPQVVSEDPRVKPLIARLERIEGERKQLLDRIAEREATIRDLEQVRDEVSQKDEQIRALLDAVTKLRANKAVRSASPSAVPLAASVSHVSEPMLDAALESVRGDLEACFDEWADRRTHVGTVGVSRRAPLDAHLIVGMAISGDGVGTDAAARGEVDLDATGTSIPVHGNLSFCVEGVLQIATYPKGVEPTDVEVHVAWAEPGLINTRARIVGRVTP
jgi:serine/threonine protein kinase